MNGDAYSYERAKRFVYDETVDRMRRSGNKPLSSENSIKRDDVGETIAFSGGTTSTRMFDLRRYEQTFIFRDPDRRHSLKQLFLQQFYGIFKGERHDV